jgi:hypothetical protein
MVGVVCPEPELEPGLAGLEDGPVEDGLGPGEVGTELGAGKGVGRGRGAGVRPKNHQAAAITSATTNKTMVMTVPGGRPPGPPRLGGGGGIWSGGRQAPKGWLPGPVGRPPVKPAGLYGPGGAPKAG